MSGMGLLAMMIAEDYQKEHPEVTWEEAMNHACHDPEPLNKFFEEGDQNESVLFE